MFISDFTYHRPATLEEACRILDETDDGALLAGGTDLLVDLKQRKRHHRNVISLTAIPILKTIHREEDQLIIGAGVTHNQLVQSPLLREHCPAVAEAARMIGTEQVRNTATIGGNLCTAASCADTAPILMAYDARVEMMTRKGTRTIPLREFFTDHRKTALSKGEILTRILLNIPSSTTGAAYRKFGLRGAANVSVASVAALVRIEEGRCAQACFVMGAVAPTPRIAKQAIGLVLDKPISELPALSESVGRAVAEEAEPIDDIRGTAAFRREITAVLARRAFNDALERATM